MTFKEDRTGEKELLNDARMIGAMVAKAHEGIEISQALFRTESKHEDTPPEYYVDSFGIRHKESSEGLPVVEVYNDDRTAEWVEFGAHAGGETPVLHYRILGRTLDILEGESHE